MLRESKLRTLPEIEEKILHLRRNYYLGQLRISWYLKRYHGIKISSGGLFGVINRNGLNRLPRNAKKRTVLTRRYENQLPGHHIQIDVKFLKFEDSTGEKVKRHNILALMMLPAFVP